MAYLVVLCSAFLHISLAGSELAIYHDIINSGIVMILSCKAVSYLLYPLLGWLADVCFTRYKFTLLAFIMMILGSVLMAVTAIISKTSIFPQHRMAVYSLGCLVIVIGLLRIGLFESTAIQFGMDQMLEASSDKLSTFIHWYYWSSNLGNLAILYISYAVVVYMQNCAMKLKIWQLKETPCFFEKYQIDMASNVGIFSAGLLLLCACTGLCLLVCYKRRLNIDRTGDHPLQLIYRVLRYAWNHKCPEKRSAFTYWEEDIPPRIDLGKSKYGGPFTTEEVEDTKTFFRIILLLFSLLGFHLSGHGYSSLDQLTRWQCPSSTGLTLTGDPINLTLLVVVVGVPLYQLVIVRYCWKYIPNLLKRIGLGLLCCLIREVVQLVIHVTLVGGKPCRLVYTSPVVSCYFILSSFRINGTCSTLSEYRDFCEVNNTPFFVMVIPNILQGFAFLLVFMSTLEFICAQAPLRLKGLLIGIWYALLAVYYLPVAVPETYITDSTTWLVFHEVKAFLIFLSLMLYLCVSRRYRYRLRDEVVNEQFLVEEIYERELALAEEHENEVEESLVVQSNNDYGSCQ